MEGARTHDARGYTGSSYMPSADPGTTGGGTYNGESLEPTIEAYENIFGPSARDIKTDLQRFKRHGRWHLPDILKGPNQYLTDRVDGLITDATNSPFTSAILPYKYITNVDGKIKWNVWSFDEGLASRVPYESAARTLQQSKRSFSGYAVRQGMAIVLEHNFMMSDAGRKNFKDQLNQLIGSIQMTNDLDVHTALVLAPSYHAHMREKYIADDKTPSQVCREFIDLFGFMQKNVNALDILIEEAKSQLQVWGSPMPDFMLANSKLTFNMQMTPERTSYVTQGPEGQKRLNTGPNISSYRGIGIIHTRAFSMETGAPPRDILRRRVRVAEYYRIAPHPDNKNRIFQLYNEERDTWFGMPFSDLLKFSHLDDGDDVDKTDSYHHESNRHIKSIGMQAVTTKPMHQALDKNLVRRLCMQRFSAMKPRRALGTVAQLTRPGDSVALPQFLANVKTMTEDNFKMANAPKPVVAGKYVVVPGHVPLYTDSVKRWFDSESAVNKELVTAFFKGDVPRQVPNIEFFKYNALQEYPAYVEWNSNVQDRIDDGVNGLSMGMQKLLYRHAFSYGRLVGDGTLEPVSKLSKYVENATKFFTNTLRSETGAFLCPNLHFSTDDGKVDGVPKDVFSQIAYSLYLTEEDCGALVNMVHKGKITRTPALNALIGAYLTKVLEGVSSGNPWNPDEVMNSTLIFLTNLSSKSIFKQIPMDDNTIPYSAAWTWPYLGTNPLTQDICYPGFNGTGNYVDEMHKAFDGIDAKGDPEDGQTGVNFNVWYQNTQADGKLDAVKNALPFMQKVFPMVPDGTTVTDQAVNDFLAVIEWRLLTDYYNGDNQKLESEVPRWTPGVRAPASAVGGDGYVAHSDLVPVAGVHDGDERMDEVGGGDVHDGSDVHSVSSSGKSSGRKPSGFHGGGSFKDHMQMIHNGQLEVVEYVAEFMILNPGASKRTVEYEAEDHLVQYLARKGLNVNVGIISDAINELKNAVRDIFMVLGGTGGGGGAGGPSGSGGGPASNADDVEIVILRPNIEHYMFGIILGKGGEQLGSTFWGQTELSCYDDSQHGIWGMSYKYHERAIVINERNLVRLWDIGYDGYVGGKDDKHLKWYDRAEVNKFKDSTLEVTKHYRGPSMLVMAFSHHGKHETVTFPDRSTATRGELYNSQFRQNWPSPIVFYDKRTDAGTTHTIGAENTHNMDTSEFRVFRDDIYWDKYEKYREHMAQYDMLHKVRKNAGQASAENESSTDALAFQGSMRVLNNSGNVIQEIHGSGHHGPDFVGVASLRAGKGYKVSTQPTMQRLV